MSAEPQPSGSQAVYGRVRELPEAERPRERLARLGPQALTTAELLAILLSTGTASEDVLQLAARLLADRGGLRGLASSDLPTLQSTRGVGAAKATTVTAAFELGRRIALEGDDLRPVILGPADIARLVQAEMELLQQEEMRLLVLDTKHRLLSNQVLYRGSVNAAPARVAELFREAVRYNAAAIAIAHNHPSGDPSPSPQDVTFTEDVVKASALMQVELLDHVVIGAGRFVSMRDRRLGFDR